MRIVNVIAYFYPHEGGAETICRNVSKELVNRGHEVIVITSNLSSRLKSELEVGQSSIDGIKLHRLNSSFFPGRLPNLMGLWSKMLEMDADVYHIHTPYPTLAYHSARALKEKSVPTIVTHHCDYVRSGIFKSYAHYLNMIVTRKLLKMSNVITVSTNSYANSSLTLRGFENKFVVWPGPPDDQYVNFRGNRNERYILFVGRLYWYKGVDLLVNAFAQLSKAYPNLNLLIVGRGPDEDKLIRLVEKMGVASNVKFLGHVSNEQLVQVYKDAYFVLPAFTRREAFGMVAVEALAMGKPVIAFDIPGVNDVLSQTNGGLLAKSRDVGDLAQKMKLLLEQPQLRMRLGKAGKEYVNSKWSLAKLTDVIENVYRVQI